MPAQRVDIFSVLLLLTRHCHDLFGPGNPPKRILITLQNDEDYLVPVPALTVPKPEEDGGNAPPPAAKAEPARHSADFRSVHWFGTDYTFNPTQAACVKVLWHAWKNGTPGVGSDTLLEASGNSAAKVQHLFRDHAAWGEMIVTPARGLYRLCDG